MHAQDRSFYKCRGVLSLVRVIKLAVRESFMKQQARPAELLSNAVTLPGHTTKGRVALFCCVGTVADLPCIINVFVLV